MEEIFQRHSAHLFVDQDVTMMNASRVVPILRQFPDLMIDFLAKIDGAGLLSTMPAIESLLPHPGDVKWFLDIDGRWVIVFRSREGHLNYFSQLHPCESGLVSTLIVRDGEDVNKLYPSDEGLDIFDLVDALSQLTSAKDLADAILADMQSILGEIIIHRQLGDLNQALLETHDSKEFHLHNTEVNSQQDPLAQEPSVPSQAFEAGLINDVISLYPPHQRENDMSNETAATTVQTAATDAAAQAAANQANAQNPIASEEVVAEAPTFSGWKKTGLFLGGAVIGAAATYGVQRYMEQREG